MKMENCIHQRHYKGELKCVLDWKVCEGNCPVYRATDRPIKNIGD